MAVAYAELGDLFLSQDGTKIVWPSETTGVLMDDFLNAVVIGNLPDETQVSWTSVGFNAGLDSIGDGVAVFGTSVARRSASDGLSVFGTLAGENNTGFFFSVFGTRAGTNNDGANNTALGAESFTDFNLDTGGTVQIAVTDTDDDLVTTTPAHGLGVAGTFWNMKAEAVTGNLPPGLNTGPDIWEVVDATTLQLFSANFTGVQTGITTLTPQFIYTNSTAVGHDAEPDATNQVMLGDPTVTEVKPFGNLTIDRETAATDAVITMDGSGNSPGTITYESDNDLFITDKDWQFLGNIIIPDDGLIGSVSDTDAMQIEADGDVVMSQDLNVSGGLTANSITTGEFTVEADGDTFWTGPGTGLFYGNMDQDGGTFTVTLTDQNTLYELDAAVTNITAGPLNDISFDGDHFLAVNTPGVYKIDWTLICSVNSVAGGDQHLEFETLVNDAATGKGESHITLRNAVRELPAGSTTLLELALNDEISIGITNTSSAGKVVTIDHLEMTVLMVGGAEIDTMIYENSDVMLYENGDTMLFEG